MEVIEQILGQINYLAVFVAALANFFIGALWYSPLLFAKVWMKEVYGTVDPAEIKQKSHMGVTMGMAFIMTFVTAFGLSVFIYWMDPDVIMMPQRVKFALYVSALISLVIICANTYKHYQFEQRSFKLAVINGLHDVVCFMTMGLIMAYWK